MVLDILKPKDGGNNLQIVSMIRMSGSSADAQPCTIAARVNMVLDCSVANTVMVQAGVQKRWKANHTSSVTVVSKTADAAPSTVMP
jgi:hypothetical protein